MDPVQQAEAELYLLAPEDFVAERDARVARAKEAGDRDSARAIGALRRPSRAAWLTNLLVRDRPDEVEGLLELAATLAAAQRSLDGATLRTISARRATLVGSLARRAAQLGRDAGHRVESTLEREVRTVLESALADPELAERVRSGHLVRAERHAGFGPSPDADAEPRPASPGGSAARASTDPGEPQPASGADGDPPADPGADRDRARRAREIARAEAEAGRARAAAERARDEHDRAREASEAADLRRDRARDRVAELVEALERARADSAEANRAAHAAATAEKEAARGARTAETSRDRAEAALRELPEA